MGVRASALPSPLDGLAIPVLLSRLTAYPLSLYLSPFVLYSGSGKCTSMIGFYPRCVLRIRPQHGVDRSKARRAVVVVRSIQLGRHGHSAFKRVLSLVLKRASSFVFDLSTTPST
ncbi:hypothetical protein GGG16DRAFT_119916 [Schizophyllum commune]